ncbi:MAG: M20/M25/M40 family metallo-hydrolase, partial [Gramella sp.]|nr:M20/M25/M40 family metallo-hydrolase [Christiangramia sp.]
IIRDHDKTHFEARKQMMKDLVSDICSQYEREIISVEIKDQYFNMREKVEPVMHIVDLAKRAMEEVDVKPIIKPIRGGTDGAQLSFMGLPCPNIFAGGHNFHGKYEYVPVESMQKAAEVIVKLAELTAKKYE